MPATLHPTIIGTVRSPLRTREECPKSGVVSLPPVWIDLHQKFEPAATDIQIGDAILVFTWLHQGDQNTLRCYPKGNRNLPQRGVFSTRSPDRPTPIGLHRVTVLDRKGPSLLIHPLEVIDGTPVVDIKPDNTPQNMANSFSALVHPDLGQAILAAGRDGWSRGLFAGFNGNISVRHGSRILITATGSAKGHLRPQDIAVVDLQTGQALSGGTASSELAVHLEVYQNQPAAQAIVHTHPPRLSALAIQREVTALAELPLFEGQVFAQKLTSVPALPPGSSALGQAVGVAAQTYPAVYMEQHGLVCWGETLIQALALSEELEGLANIALNLK